MSVELASEKPQSHLVSCRAQVIFLQGLFGVLKGLKRELLLPPGLDVGQEGQVPRSPGQSPQELCIVATHTHTKRVIIVQLNSD